MAHLKKRNGIYYLVTNVDGVWKPKSLRTRHKKLALAERDRANNVAPSAPALFKKDLGFADLKKHYVAWATNRLAHSTIALRLWALASFESITGAARLSQCTPDAIHRYVSARQSDAASARTFVNWSTGTNDTVYAGFRADYVAKRWGVNKK